MSEQNQKLVTPAGAVTDVIIAAVIFLFFMFVVIPPHVPFHEPLKIYLFSAYTSLIMAGFFWMALSLFRVTRVDQKLRKKSP